MGLGSMGLGRTVGNTHVGAGMVLVQPLTHGFGCRSTHGCTHARLYCELQKTYSKLGMVEYPHGTARTYDEPGLRTHEVVQK